MGKMSDECRDLRLQFFVPVFRALAGHFEDVRGVFGHGRDDSQNGWPETNGSGKCEKCSFPWTLLDVDLRSDGRIISSDTLRLYPAGSYREILQG
jgi:hypothetical protein